ncbi:MAG: MraY family glycosyltransferase [Pseudomonadota bacterium]
MKYDIVVAFFGVLVFTGLFHHLAIRLNLLDTPGGRKQHHGAIPLIGGITMFLGFTFAIFILPISLMPYRPFFAALGLIMIIGILDDFHEISARVKLMMQIIAALIVILFGNTTVHQLGALLPGLTTLHLGYLAIPFTVIAIVGIVNAINMIDGIDGLAGGVLLIQFISLLFLAIHANRLSDVRLLLLLVTVLVAFLLLNYPLPIRNRAIIFMGDAGSMFLGFCLAWFCIHLSQIKPVAASPVVFLWIIVIPLFDMSAVTFRRIFHKRSPFSPGRDHMHHILLDLGLSVRQVTFILYLISIVMAAIGIACHLLGVADSVLFIIIILLFIAYIVLLNYLLKWTKQKN